jgi:lysophospholipase L1-like esterase
MKAMHACVAFALALLTVAAASPSTGQTSTPPEHWVSAWSAAAHATLPFPGLPPTPAFENQTIRMVVRPTIGGERLRILFSNAFGADAVEIGAAHIAITRQGASIVPESDHVLRFGGRTSVSVPPGAPILSDPVDLNVRAFTELTVSVYVPDKTPGSTVHFWAQHDTYVSGAGDFTKSADFAEPVITKSWYWLADVEVWSPAQTATIVTLGDSITDGVGAKQGDYADWPDMLAKRLAAEQKVPQLAVANEGIGGNRVLHDGAGVSALARLDRDVLAQPGVTDLIVLESINDIGWPHMKPPPSKDGTVADETPFVKQHVSAEDLIVGLQQIIDRAHEHGIRVFGGTLTPFKGADYYSDEGEASRQAVNQWIRAGSAFDGFFDFDAVVRDPNHPAQFREDFHSGDHLHPNAAGYQAMANAIDLSALRGRAEGAKTKSERIH